MALCELEHLTMFKIVRKAVKLFNTLSSAYSIQHLSHEHQKKKKKKKEKKPLINWLFPFFSGEEIRAEDKVFKITTELVQIIQTVHLGIF